MFFVFAHKFAYLMHKNICRSSRAPRIARASKTALAVRSVVQFLCCFRLQNYAATKGISGSTFILTPLNQSKHSNLFKTKQAITNKQKEQLQTKNNNVEPTQAF